MVGLGHNLPTERNKTPTEKNITATEHKHISKTIARSSNEAEINMVRVFSVVALFVGPAVISRRREGLPTRIVFRFAS